jgi:hypothetical protein
MEFSSSHLFRRPHRTANQFGLWFSDPWENPPPDWTAAGRVTGVIFAKSFSSWKRAAFLGSRNQSREDWHRYAGVDTFDSAPVP